MLVLAVATIVLVVFILLLGDARRRRAALFQAEWYAAALSSRYGESPTLPLNLDIEPAGRQQIGSRIFKRLTRLEARRLRHTDHAVMVVWTQPVRQVLARDGRAVIFFENGVFRFDWLSPAEFDEAHAAQQAELDRLTPKAGNEPSAPP